ncbi:hypothetical protein [Aquiflexum sp.]|uniref:hypothetical protein n=1 Tax=Aquiflexum sp. TaxID=1872584 RepID=UPI0035936361
MNRYRAKVTFTFTCELDIMTRSKMGAALILNKDFEMTDKGIQTSAGPDEIMWSMNEEGVKKVVSLKDTNVKTKPLGEKIVRNNGKVKSHG